MVECVDNKIQNIQQSVQFLKHYSSNIIQAYKMGQSNVQIGTNVLTNWKPHPFQQQVLYNVLTHEQVQKHFVIIKDRHQIRQYSMRMQQNDIYVCKVLYYHPTPENAFEQSPKQFYIYTQRMLPITQWKSDSSLLVVKGFKRLFGIYKAFRVEKNMIGQNERGQVKVWLNSNPIMNFPADPSANQQQMLVDLSNILLFYDKQSANVLISCKTFSQSVTKIKFKYQEEAANLLNNSHEFKNIKNLNEIRNFISQDKKKLNQEAHGYNRNINCSAQQRPSQESVNKTKINHFISNINKIGSPKAPVQKGHFTMTSFSNSNANNYQNFTHNAFKNNAQDCQYQNAIQKNRQIFTQMTTKKEIQSIKKPQNRQQSSEKDYLYYQRKKFTSNYEKVQQSGEKIKKKNNQLLKGQHQANLTEQTLGLCEANNKKCYKNQQNHYQNIKIQPKDVKQVTKSIKVSQKLKSPSKQKKQLKQKIQIKSSGGFKKQIINKQCFNQNDQKFQKRSSKQQKIILQLLDDRQQKPKDYLPFDKNHKFQQIKNNNDQNIQSHSRYCSNQQNNQLKYGEKPTIVKSTANQASKFESQNKQIPQQQKLKFSDQEVKKKNKQDMTKQLKKQFGQILQRGNYTEYKVNEEEEEIAKKSKTNTEDSQMKGDRLKVTRENVEDKQKQKIHKIICDYAQSIKDQLIKEKIQKKKNKFAELKLQAKKILSDDFI